MLFKKKVVQLPAKLFLPTKIILLKYKRSSIRNTDSNIFKMKYIYKNINISISILVTFY